MFRCSCCIPAHRISHRTASRTPPRLPFAAPDTRLATTGPYAAAHGIRCPPKTKSRARAEGIRVAARPRRGCGWGSDRSSTRGVAGSGLRPPGSSAGSSSRSRVQRPREEKRDEGEERTEMRGKGRRFLSCVRGLLPLYDGGRPQWVRVGGFAGRLAHRPICIFA